MTYHFVNLVSAVWIMDNLHGQGRYYCDSITMKWFARLRGYHVNRISGISASKQILNLEKKVILGKGINADIELPHWSSSEEVELTKDILNSLCGYQTIIIGISSPKQDRLALLINKEFPNANIYCLGAAVSGVSIRSIVSDKYAMSWFILLIRDPKRFVNKLGKMITNFLILLKESNYQKSINLLQIFERDLD